MICRIDGAVALDDHTVIVTWSDGVTVRVDLVRALAAGPVFEPMRDEAYFVETMMIAESGLGLEWPNGVDFSADGLRVRAFSQGLDETAP